MKMNLDVCGLSCPEPVLKLQQIIDTADEIELLTDSQTCVENCSRFALSKGFRVSVSDAGGQYTMSLKKA
jgi:TusA-related sulfurtransferase